MRKEKSADFIRHNVGYEELPLQTGRLPAEHGFHFLPVDEGEIAGDS